MMEEVENDEKVNLLWLYDNIFKLRLSAKAYIISVEIRLIEATLQNN